MIEELSAAKLGNEQIVPVYLVDEKLTILQPCLFHLTDNIVIFHILRLILTTNKKSKKMPKKNLIIKLFLKKTWLKI